MLEEHVDLVAADFNGAAWRHPCFYGSLSIIEEAFADTHLPMPPGPTPLWRRGAVPGDWTDVCSLRTLLKDGMYVSKVHSSFPTILWASVQRVNAAIRSVAAPRFR